MKKYVNALQRLMLRVKGLIKKYPKISITVVAVVLILIIVTVVKKGGTADETVTVERKSVIETVQIAGSVEADIVSNLGFEVGGTVRDVLVKTNDVVRKGDRLVTLDLGTLSAELASAQARLAIKEAELQNTKINLDSVQAKQDTLVASAHKKLLSDGLIVEPENGTYAQTAPIITGRYEGEEGTYKVIIESGVQSNDFVLRTFGVEESGNIAISNTGATRLGNRGLYISFPQDLDEYVNTIWYVAIPNKKSASYISNLNAYDEALRARDEALNEANETLRSQQVGSSVAEAELASAKADVARVQALIGQRILRAPFNGTVTAVSIDPGESIGTTGTSTVVSLISEGKLGVKINLPEVDSVKVSIGDKATITLDAFGTGTIFSGTVVSVDRAETVVEGVPVYQARVIFDEDNQQIVSGMTANVAIETDRTDNAIAIPVRAIHYTEQGEPIVTVSIDDKKTEQRTIAVGLRGSDSFIEVLAGLKEGDRIIIPTVTK